MGLIILTANKINRQKGDAFMEVIAPYGGCKPVEVAYLYAHKFLFAQAKKELMLEGINDKSMFKFGCSFGEFEIMEGVVREISVNFLESVRILCNSDKAGYIFISEVNSEAQLNAFISGQCIDFPAGGCIIDIGDNEAVYTEFFRFIEQTLRRQRTIFKAVESMAIEVHYFLV